MISVRWIFILGLHVVFDGLSDQVINIDCLNTNNFRFCQTKYVVHINADNEVLNVRMQTFDGFWIGIGFRSLHMNGSYTVVYQYSMDNFRWELQEWILANWDNIDNGILLGYMPDYNLVSRRGLATIVFDIPWKCENEYPRKCFLSNLYISANNAK